MDRRRVWLGRDGWWRKEDWPFEVKFAEETYKKVKEDDNSELQLQDVVQFVTHVQGIDDDGDLIATLFDAMESSGVSLLRNLKSLNLGWNNYPKVGMLSLSLSSGKLPNLSRLDISRNGIGNEGAKSLGVAIRSGDLKNLAKLVLICTGIGDEGLTALAESFQDGVVSPLPNLKSLNLGWNRFTEVGMLSLAESLSSGKLPNLSRLNISSNQIGNEGAEFLGVAIRSGELKNLAELYLLETGIEDEGLTALAESFLEGVGSLLPNLKSLNLFRNNFTEVGLLALAEALKSGRLNLLRDLDVRVSKHPSEEGASALVSALLTNNCLTADVRFEWDKFPELDRRRRQLIERNSRNRDILEGLLAVPKVQATFGTVYICGNPEAGKTTLRRTLQRSFRQSLFTWEKRPHLEPPTRGIDVSQFSSKASKPDENPITLLVWDMDFHYAFVPDLGFAEGRAMTFIVVCRSDNSPENSKEQLEYWLRYIASSCDKAIQNPRQVFVIMNNIKGDRKTHRDAEQWKLMLEGQRDKFEQHLQIQTKVFLMDVRRFRLVDGLKSCLLEHSRNLLRNQEVPDICQAIQQNLTVFSLQTRQFPVLQWKGFVEQVQKLLMPRSEQIIEAAAKYLNEAGVIIYIHTEGVRLVVVDPNWFCREIIGKVFLPREMASPLELIFRDEVDQSTGSISISRFKKFFKSLEGEWNGTQVDDMIAILLWLGLCYKGKDENVFIPALIARKGTPGGPWALQTQVEHGGNQWVMGFSVRHRETEVALAPISLWHRFQVDLAQTLKFESETPDNDFVADKHFMTFVKDYMNVLIEVDANVDKPTFEEISILVKPSFKRGELVAAQRKQWQVDLADDLVERLLKLWNQYCPGVEYVTKVIWPWPASWSRPEDMTDRNVDVEEVKRWVRERGMGRQMQWLVGSGDSITQDQLLSTKDKQWFATSKTSGIEGHALQPGLIELKVACCKECREKLREALMSELDGVVSVKLHPDSEKVTIYGKVKPEDALKKANKVVRGSEFCPKKKEEEKKIDPLPKKGDLADNVQVVRQQRSEVEMLRTEHSSLLEESRDVSAQEESKEPEIMDQDDDAMGIKGLLAAEEDGKKLNVADQDCESNSNLGTLQNHLGHGKQQDFVRDFIREINRGESGYFVSKTWYFSLEEHQKETLMSILGRSGYLEFYQTRTTIIYRRMGNNGEVLTLYNDLARTPETNDIFNGETEQLVASDDSSDSGEIEEKGHSTKTQDGKELGSASQTERSDVLDSEICTVPSFENKIQSAMVQTNETSRLGSLRSLPDKGKTTFPGSNEKLESFKKTLKDTGLYSYSVSTQWLSTLSDHEVEDVNTVLFKAGYSQIDKTSTTTYLKRPHDHVHQRETTSTIERRTLVGDMERSKTFQGTEAFRAKKLQDLDDMEVTSKIQARQKRKVDCGCLPQDITVSCTPSSQGPVEPSTSSFQRGFSKHSTRDPVGNCYVTMPRNRKQVIMNTGADKTEVMGTVEFDAEKKPYLKPVTLDVSADTSLSCCLTKDGNNSKVRFEFLKIQGAVKMEGSMNLKTNALVLRAVRANVVAHIINAENSEVVHLRIINDRECKWPIKLGPHQSIDEDGQPRKVLWMGISPSDPINSECGSKNLELRCHDIFWTYPEPESCNHELLFSDHDWRVMVEGDFRTHLDQNSFLQLSLRYQLEYCLDEAVDPLPQENPYLGVPRVTKKVDFGCVLELRTFGSAGSSACTTFFGWPWFSPFIGFSLLFGLVVWLGSLVIFGSEI